MHADAMLAAFRAEIGATVRHVSPFLLALLDGTGVTVDDVVEGVRPAPGWPDRPGVPAFRHLVGASSPGDGNGASGFAPGPPRSRTRLTEVPAMEMRLPRWARLHAYIVDHSLEAAGWWRESWFDSLFGMLRVEFPASPGSAFPSLEGRRLEDVLEVPACLRRGWIVGQSARGHEAGRGLLAVRTGVRRYRVPWAR